MGCLLFEGPNRYLMDAHTSGNVMGFLPRDVGTLKRSEYQSPLTEDMLSTDDLEKWSNISAELCEVGVRVAKDFQKRVEKPVWSRWKKVPGREKEPWKAATMKYQTETSEVLNSDMCSEDKIAWLRKYHFDPDPVVSDASTRQVTSQGSRTTKHKGTGVPRIGRR